MKPQTSSDSENVTEKNPSQMERKDLIKELEFLRIFAKNQVGKEMTQLQEDLSKVQGQLLNMENEYSAADIQKIKTDILEHMARFDDSFVVDTSEFRFTPGWSKNDVRDNRKYLVEYVTNKCIQEKVNPLSFDELQNLFKDTAKRVSQNSDKLELDYGLKNSAEKNSIVETKIDAWIQEHKVEPLKALKAKQGKTKEALQKKQAFLASMESF